MTDETVYVVSLTYSPGLAKEFTLLGRKLRADGRDVRYLLAEDYRWLVDEGDATFVDTGDSTVRGAASALVPWPSIPDAAADAFASTAPDRLFFYNTHPTNLVLASRSTAVNVFFLHEPFVPDKSSFGVGQRWKNRVAERIHGLSLRLASDVVLPSVRAYNLFRRRWPGFDGGVHYAPLLLPDSDQVPGRDDRDVVTAVGQFNQSRSVDEFFSVVERAAARDDAADCRFKVVTASDIGEQVARLEDPVRERLEIVSPDRITDAEIASAVAHSTAIVLTHRYVTQSGTVPVAFRQGTPVVARALPGFSQDVVHGENGYLVSDAFDPDEVLAGVGRIHGDFDAMSNTARDTFEQKFGEDNWRDYYGPLFGD